MALLDGLNNDMKGFCVSYDMKRKWRPASKRKGIILTLKFGKHKQCKGNDLPFTSMNKTPKFILSHSWVTSFDNSKAMKY